MEIFNTKNIPLDIINTLEISNDAWGIKDTKSCFVYANNALKKLQSLSHKFSYGGLYDDEIPWEGAQFHKEFILHDKMVIARKQTIISLETHKYFKNTYLTSYLCQKIPFFDENNECQGIVFYGRKAEPYYLNRLYQGKLPASLIFTPPIEILSAREWDIIFLFIHDYSRKQTAEILKISHRTIEYHFTSIFKKIGVKNIKQLREYCYEKNFQLYIPEHLFFFFTFNKI
nr:LuxR C-terminal-related transcriptional regulator [uncultured Moellerella sp.]